MAKYLDEAGLAKSFQLVKEYVDSAVAGIGGAMLYTDADIFVGDSGGTFGDAVWVYDTPGGMRTAYLVTSEVTMTTSAYREGGLELPKNDYSFGDGNYSVHLAFKASASFAGANPTVTLLSQSKDEIKIRLHSSTTDSITGVVLATVMGPKEALQENEE